MTPQNTTWLEECWAKLERLKRQRSEKLKKQKNIYRKEKTRAEKNLHRFCVFLPFFIGIFNCAAGILAREVFMLVLGVGALICALFIDLVMEGTFD
ncbi:hypothetical protein ES703_49679 [subsurface metagenome]